jgi:hypothetical protein
MRPGGKSTRQALSLTGRGNPKFPVRIVWFLRARDNQVRSPPTSSLACAEGFVVSLLTI